MLADPVEHGTEGLALRLHHCGADELRLTPVTMGWHHHPSGDRGRDAGAVLGTPEVQARVDAGGRAGGGHHLPVVDVQHLGDHHGVGEARREVVGVHPVRGAPATVEQPGLPQDEGRGAHRQDTCPACDGVAHDVEHLLGHVLRLPEGRGEAHQVGLGHALEAVHHVERETERRAHLPGPGRADREVDRRHAVLGAIDPPGLAEDPELEGLYAVPHDDGHVAQHRSSVARAWQKIEGH